MVSKAMIRGYGGAVGGGKSRTGCEEVFNASLDYPGLITLVARDAHTSIVETTKKTMLEQVIPSALIDHRKSSGGEDYIQLWNGSRIHFIGLDNPYRWYSAEIGYLFFDEAQEIEEEAVLKLMNRLRQPGMPHRTICTFNPSNPGHWLQNWFMNGSVPTNYGIEGVVGSRKEALTFREGEIDGEDESYGDVDFVFARATDNPYLPESYIKRLKAQPMHMRRRYFEGIWEYVDGSCFFELDALAWYQEQALKAKVLATGILIGDIDQDVNYRVKRGPKPEPNDRIRVARAKQGSLGPFVVWKMPVRKTSDSEAHRYVVSVDASSGKGKDYTGIQVLDIDEFEQVAEMQVQLAPEAAAETVYRIGRLYNDALVVCEVTGGWGFAVDQSLRRMRYPRPYTRNIIDRLSKKFTDKLGFDTTNKTRPMILSLLEESIREKSLKLWSVRSVAEMGSFVWTDKGKAEAQPGMHDDLVMSLAMAVYICISQPKQVRRVVERPYQPQFTATGY